MQDLIERLEKATGPDRELDGLIFQEVGGDHWLNAMRRSQEPSGCPLEIAEVTARTYAPSFTASIDAALTLVPEGMWWLIGAGQTRPDEPLYGAQIRKPGFSTGGEVVSEAEHSCMAVALCMAALKARNATSGK